MKLTQDEKRIRIAEACGWTFIERLAFTGIPKWGHGNSDARVIPDYFTSLDACHEMEEAIRKPKMPGNKWAFYKEKLEVVCAITGDDVHHATAAQRAEAFGLTLGLWESGQ